MDLEFVEEIPEPSRSAISQVALEQLQKNKGKWAVIAREGDEDGLTQSTVRSRGISLQQYAGRRNLKDNVEIAERTIDGRLHVYARWVDGKSRK